MDYFCFFLYYSEEKENRQGEAIFIDVLKGFCQVGLSNEKVGNDKPWRRRPFYCLRASMKLSMPLMQRQQEAEKKYTDVEEGWGASSEE